MTVPAIERAGRPAATTRSRSFSDTRPGQRVPCPIIVPRAPVPTNILLVGKSRESLEVKPHTPDIPDRLEVASAFRPLRPAPKRPSRWRATEPAVDRILHDQDRHLPAASLDPSALAPVRPAVPSRNRVSMVARAFERPAELGPTPGNDRPLGHAPQSKPTVTGVRSRVSALIEKGRFSGAFHSLQKPAYEHLVDGPPRPPARPMKRAMQAAANYGGGVEQSEWLYKSTAGPCSVNPVGPRHAPKHSTPQDLVGFSPVGN